MIRVLNKDYRAKLYNDLNLASSTQSRQIDSCNVCVCGLLQYSLGTGIQNNSVALIIIYKIPKQ